MKMCLFALFFLVVGAGSLRAQETTKPVDAWREICAKDVPVKDDELATLELGCAARTLFSEGGGDGRYFYLVNHPEDKKARDVFDQWLAGEGSSKNKAWAAGALAPADEKYRNLFEAVAVARCDKGDLRTFTHPSADRSACSEMDKGALEFFFHVREDGPKALEKGYRGKALTEPEIDVLHSYRMWMEIAVRTPHYLPFQLKLMRTTPHNTSFGRGFQVGDAIPPFELPFLDTVTKRDAYQDLPYDFDPAGFLHRASLLFLFDLFDGYEPDGEALVAKPYHRETGESAEDYFSYPGTWANNAAYGIDSNIYWSTETTAPSFDGGTFAQWKARGHGLHSSIADPGFADPEGFDFSLGPGSPAVALGFNPIDADEAGLYGNAAWVQAPLGITRDPFNIPAGQGFGLSDGEDFESTAVGAEPDLGHAVPGGDPNLLSVTDAVAAAGAHSLKVADASGLGQTWYPYIYYTGDFLGGNIRLSFDLRLEPGAIFIAETRKYSGASYQAGPSPRVNSSGQLTSQGNVLISSLPYNQWIHFQIDYTLGPTSTGTYDLTVTPQGGSPQVFLGLGTDGHPREFSWLGFLSPGTTAHTFYLDNIKFEEL